MYQAQIWQKRNEISALRSGRRDLINEKERLERARTRLFDAKVILDENVKLIDSPSISYKSWNGNECTTHTTMRGNFRDAYNSGGRSRCVDAFEAIDNAIARAEEGIESRTAGIDWRLRAIETLTRKQNAWTSQQN